MRYDDFYSRIRRWGDFPCSLGTAAGSRRRSPSGFLMVSVLLLCGCRAALPAQAAELDRLIASVNGKVLTRSDLELARQLNALVLFGRDSEEPAPAEQVERLVDLELLRGELEIFAMEADEGALQSRLQELRNGYAEMGGLPALLARIGLLERELREYLRLQLALQRFVQFRFRPFADPAEPEVERYYRERFVPELHRRGLEVPPLDDVSEKIAAVLREEQANAALERWLAEMRGQARIERFDLVRGGPEGGRNP